jgi:hypothetical protein
MSTFRLFSSTSRLATGIRLRNGSLYQVYPSKETYESVQEWGAKYPSAVRLEEMKQPPPKPKKLSNALVRRRDRELMEFADPDYAWMFTSLRIELLPRPKIYATLLDDSQWTLERDLEFLKHPPSVTKNGVPVGEDLDWYPALTSIRWLMMLAFSEVDS